MDHIIGEQRKNAGMKSKIEQITKVLTYWVHRIC
jgi:hypothetical protein